MTTVRVLIRLSPPLVGDLLARILRQGGHDGVEVSTDVGEGAADILVTAEPVGPNPPPTVIVLDEPIAPGTAHVHGRGTSEDIAVLDLDAIASVVRGLCAPAQAVGDP